MELFGHKLSDEAINFVEKYSVKLDKPIKHFLLSDSHPSFGAMDNADEFYVIGVRSNVPTKSFEATFCHELYHAYQFSCGFPTVICNDKRMKDYDKFAEHLRSCILDLSAEEAVVTHGLDNSFVSNFRYKHLKNHSRARFCDVADGFGEVLLVIDLLIDSRTIKPEQFNLLFGVLKEYRPDVAAKYLLYKEEISKNDYFSSDGCLKILGFIINDLNKWDGCHIVYNEKKIKGMRQLERIFNPQSVV